MSHRCETEYCYPYSNPPVTPQQGNYGVYMLGSIGCGFLILWAFVATVSWIAEHQRNLASVTVNASAQIATNTTTNGSMLSTTEHKDISPDTIIIVFLSLIICLFMVSMIFLLYLNPDFSISRKFVVFQRNLYLKMQLGGQSSYNRCQRMIQGMQFRRKQKTKSCLAISDLQLKK